MNESDSSDGMEELQELIDEYKSKEDEPVSNNAADVNVEPRETKPKMRDIKVPMEKVVFGDKTEYIRNLASAVGSDNDEGFDDEQEAERKAQKRKPAWIDADDERLEVGEVKRETKYTGPLDHLRKDKTYKEYLTRRFERAVGAQPKWASLDHKESAVDSDDEDGQLLRTVGFLEKPSDEVLSPNNLAFRRLKDLNRATYSEGTIHSIQFHPTSTAALVAGESGLATIYGIDGKQNEQLHTIRFKDFPTKCTRITPCGKKALFGSYKRVYYSYDLIAAQETRFITPRGVKNLQHFELSPCGRFMVSNTTKDTEMHLFDAQSQELIHSFHVESVVAGMQFTGDSTRIICNARSCNVSVYSLRQQRLEHSFIDDGCINGKALHLAPNQRLLATGSREGVVNVYDLDNVMATNTPKPEKTFLNLTTSIADLKFNSTSELLAMSSSDVTDAVKIAHVASASIYANFPGFNSNLGMVRRIEFSPRSGYLALGTVKQAPLFRLKHFKNY